MTICERCGATTTDETALFCGICGAPLPKQAPAPAAAPAPAPAPAPKGVIAPGPRAGAPRTPKAVSPDERPRGTIPEGPISAALKPVEAPPAAQPPPAVLPPGAPGEKPFKPPKHLPAGALVDKKYAILRVLGEGGMGVVYLARDIHTGLDVVVKAVRSELAHRDDVRARTLAEGRALAQIDHPNVVHLRAVAVEGTNLYLVMQHIEGESLDKIIRGYVERGEKMPVEEALGIFRQIAAGVGAAHQEGVVHRDLKPANVLLRRKDRVAKVTDFGIALMPTERDRPHTRGILGSLWYMSPEQVTGRRDLDHRVDIYALGILLYQMLVGRVPFDAKSDYDIMKLHAEAPMPLVAASRPDVPRAVDDIVQRACAKDRDQRFASCDELIAAVDRVLGAGPASAKPGSTPIPFYPVAQGPYPAAQGDAMGGAPAQPVAMGEPPRPPLQSLGDPAAAPSPEGQAAVPASAPQPSHAGIAVTASLPGDTPPQAATAPDVPPPRPRARWPWAVLALLVVGGGAAGAAAGFGFVPGVKGIWKVPKLPFEATTASARPPSSAVAPRASGSASARPPGSAVAARPPSSLDPLVGSWIGNGRELDAVLVGNDLEFRVKKPEQFAQQRYEVGEARFVLRSTSDASVFAAEDRIRPVPPPGRTYDPRSRGTCQEVWTTAGGEPLRARWDGTRLSVDFAKIEPGPANFTLEGAKITSCVGLRDLKASKVVSVLSRQ